MKPREVATQFGVKAFETKREVTVKPTIGMRPGDLAKRYSIGVQKVLRWIETGELRAMNIAASLNGKKPRWVILPDDLEAFELRRRTQPPVPPRPRRRKSQQVGQFFDLNTGERLHR